MQKQAKLSLAACSQEAAAPGRHQDGTAPHAGAGASAGTVAGPDGVAWRSEV